jgi:hypothetical protein
MQETGNSKAQNRNQLTPHGPREPIPQKEGSVDPKTNLDYIPIFHKADNTVSFWSYKLNRWNRIPLKELAANDYELKCMRVATWSLQIIALAATI